MSHQLQLEVPDEIYQSLVDAAQATGGSVEELAVKWLASAEKHLGNDPLEEFIGAFSGGPPDWADNHDKYIGLSILDTHDTSDDGSDG